MAPKKQPVATEKPEAALPDGEDGKKTKKPRTSNPGVRIQGGRIYDSENGTTCHQCRQKTIEIKAKCNTCTLYFCPRCLENRYSEGVDEANKTPGWSCPKCRKLCNCSNCRKKQGLEATGILAKVAKTAGFGSVSDLLKKNPNAQSLTMMRSAAGGGDGAADTTNTTTEGSAAGTSGKKPVTGSKRKSTTKAAQASSLVPDGELEPRTALLPEATPIGIHKPVANTPGAKRLRGAPAWLNELPTVTKIPDGVNHGELLSIIEFLQVFGPVLGMKEWSHSAGIAAELCQPATSRQRDLLVPVPEDSLVAAVHAALLGIVRKAWGVVGNSTVSISHWQALMQSYYAASKMDDAWVVQREYGPPAVAGELFIRPPQDDANDADDDMGVEETTTTDSGDLVNRVVARGGVGAPSVAIEYPEGGYWSVDPATRVSMLHALVHDALDTYTLRELMDKSMGDAAAGEKERKSNLADARREAKEAAAKIRDQEIAMIIASGEAKSMSLEEQRRLLEDARRKAEETSHAASAAKVVAFSGTVHPATVRVAALGVDRDGLVFYKLQSSAAVGDGDSILVVTQEGEYACIDDAVGVVQALDDKGQNEGPLKHAVTAAFNVGGHGGAGGKKNKKTTTTPATKTTTTPATGKGKPPKAQTTTGSKKKPLAAGNTNSSAGTTPATDVKKSGSKKRLSTTPSLVDDVDKAENRVVSSSQKKKNSSARSSKKATA